MKKKNQKVDEEKKVEELTLEKALKILGLKNDSELLNLFTPNRIMKVQLNIRDRFLDNLRVKLKKQENELKIREQKFQIDDLKLKVDYKSLMMENIDLDKQIEDVTIQNTRIGMEILEKVRVRITPQDVTTGNQQLIATYLNKEFDKILSEMRSVLPEFKNKPKPVNAGIQGNGDPATKKGEDKGKVHPIKKSIAKPDSKKK